MSPYLDQTELGIVNLTDICFKYGVTPAAETLLTIPAERREKGQLTLQTLQSFTSHDLIRLMNFKGDIAEEDVIHLEQNYKRFLEWLNFYSILEISIIAQTIPQELLNSNFKTMAIEEISHFPPGAYIEAGFPLAAMFLLRMEGKNNFTTVHSIYPQKALGRLLRLDDSIRHDPEVISLFWSAGFREMDQTEANELSKQLTYLKEFSKGEFKEGEAIYENLKFWEGIWKLFSFCIELHSLLIQADRKDPEFSCFLRAFYAHVFDSLGDRLKGPLHRKISEVLDLLESLAIIQDDLEGQKGVKNLNQIIQQLTSKTRWPLPEEINTLIENEVFAPA